LSELPALSVATGWLPKAHVPDQPEHASSQQSASVLPVMLLEEDFKTMPLLQLWSVLESVLPLHLPVMSASQQMLAEEPTVDPASNIRWKPSSQAVLKPEHKSSQQAASLVPEMLSEFVFSCLWLLQVQSLLETVLPLHIVTSQHELFEEPTMLSLPTLSWKPSWQVQPEHSSSQQVAVSLPVMSPGFDFSCWSAPQVTSALLSVLPLHLPVMSASQQMASVAVAAVMEEASALR